VKYPPVKDGDQVTPKMRGYKMCCCDCGLVHKMDFDVLKVTKKFKDGSYRAVEMSPTTYRVRITPSRDYRATAAVRREAKKKAE
jgi:hypothetical protein